MGVINILLYQSADQNNYTTFFADNSKTFYDAGVAVPWFKKKPEKGPYQVWQAASSHIRSLEAGNDIIWENLQKMLTDCRHLLLMGTIPNIQKIADLTDIIKRHRLSGWESIDLRCVWLATPKSFEFENAYRWDPDPARLTHFQKAALHYDGLRIELIKNILDIADTVSVLVDNGKDIITVDRLMEALRLPPVNPEELKPLRDVRFNSRELYWFAGKAAQLPDLDYPTAAAILKKQDIPVMLPFLDPELLRRYDELYNEELEKLALEKSGEKISLEKTVCAPAWQPFTAPDGHRQKEILAKFVRQLPTDYGASTERLLERASWLFSDDFKFMTVPEGKKPLLSVLTLTYNQERFIGECIESVAVQKLDCPFQHLILDDGSTDDTKKIVLEYADKYPHITPIFLKRPHKAGENVRRLLEACKSPFAALCEGDDYFTDPLKLQKQLDYLKNHPDFAICFHPVDVVCEDGSPKRIYPPEDKLPGGVRPFYTLKDLLYMNLMQTNSVMYRWRFTDGLPDWFTPHLIPGDWYLHILHAETGLIGYMPETMAVYRRHSDSLYAKAEKSSKSNRHLFGMRELEVYDNLDRHFKMRFHKDFLTLASGVYMDFIKILEDGDGEPLDKASERFPAMTKEILNLLQI